MSVKYEGEVEQLRGKVSAITGYVDELRDKALLDGEDYMAIACADFVSNTMRSFEYIVDQCEEGEE